MKLWPWPWRREIGTRMSFDEYSGQYLPAGSGLKALSAQAANEALRHCRIGVVTLKNA